MPRWPRLKVVVVGDRCFGQLLAEQGHQVEFIGVRQPVPPAQLYLIDLPENEVTAALADLSVPADALVGIHTLGGYHGEYANRRNHFVFAYLGAGDCVLSAADDLTSEIAELFFTESFLHPHVVSFSDYPAQVARKVFPIICELVGHTAMGKSAILPPRLDGESASYLRQWLPVNVQPLYDSMIAYLL